MKGLALVSYLMTTNIICLLTCSCYVNIRFYLFLLRVIMFVSDLWHVGGFLRVLRFSPPKKLTASIYNSRNIVESGVKQDTPTIKRFTSYFSYFRSNFVLFEWHSYVFVSLSIYGLGYILYIWSYTT